MNPRKWRLILLRKLKRRLKPKCMCLVLAATILLYVFLYLAKLIATRYQCSLKETREAIDALCAHYSHGNITGDLCPHICSSNFDISCLNYRGGKTVLHSKWRGMDTIIKSKHAYLHQYDAPGYMDSGVQYLPTTEEFCSMVVESVSINTGVSFPGESCDVLQHVWNDRINLSDYLQQTKAVPMRTDRTRGSVFTSIWSLMQQDEFVMMKIYRHKAVPQIYASCGHFYAMEYTPTGDILRPRYALYYFHDKSWNERARLALKLLDLIDALDGDFKEPMHMCDMKVDNFGVASNGIVQMIDMDMVFNNHRVGEIVAGAGENCKKHSDCWFFDCFGWCDVKNSMCVPVRTNNNLQVVCDKILLSHPRNGYQGLLRYIPHDSKHDLWSILQSCANPELSPDLHKMLPGCKNIDSKTKRPPCHNPYASDIRFRADPSILNKLYKTIARSIQTEKISGF